MFNFDKPTHTHENKESPLEKYSSGLRKYLMIAAFTLVPALSFSQEHGKEVSKIYETKTEISLDSSTQELLKEKIGDLESKFKKHTKREKIIDRGKEKSVEVVVISRDYFLGNNNEQLKTEQGLMDDNLFSDELSVALANKYKNITVQSRNIEEIELMSSRINLEELNNVRGRDLKIFGHYKKPDKYLIASTDIIDGELFFSITEVDVEDMDTDVLSLKTSVDEKSKVVDIKTQDLMVDLTAERIGLDVLEK